VLGRGEVLCVRLSTCVRSLSTNIQQAVPRVLIGLSISVREIGASASHILVLTDGVVWYLYSATFRSADLHSFAVTAENRKPAVSRRGRAQSFGYAMMVRTQHTLRLLAGRDRNAVRVFGIEIHQRHKRAALIQAVRGRL